MDDLEKALEEIVKNYLIRETSAELKTPGGSKEAESAKEIPDKTIASTNKEEDHDSSEQDSEFATNVYQCLLEKGVLREVHAFIRHKLVEVLRGTYPQIVRSGCDSKFSSAVINLVEDFLITHNLLFTYSVLMSELNGGYQSKREPGIYGKLKPGDAETLLEEISIPKDSSFSRLLLKKYSEDDRNSLLDTFVELFPTKDLTNGSVCPTIISSVYKSQLSPKQNSVDDPPSERDWQDSGNREKSLRDSGGESIDAKLFQMHFNVERDAHQRIQNELQRFQDNELQKIRKDVEASYKYKFLSKEQELLRAYDDRVAAMKQMMDQEKQIWLGEKAHKEKELEFQRNNLMKLMNHVREKKLKTNSAHSNRDFRTVTENRTQSVALGYNDRVPNLSVFPNSSTSDDTENLPEKLNGFVANNVRIMSSKDEIARRRHSVRFNTDPRESEPETSRNKRNKPGPDAVYMKSLAEDKVAFLQLAVEQQSEEIRKLKSQVARKTAQDHGATPVSNSDLEAPSVPVCDSDLETFLTESKQRFAEIEKKAERVTLTLRQVFQRNQGSKSTTDAINAVGSGNTTIRNPTITTRHQTANNFNLSITPSFLTESGSFHQNLRSFLIEDDTKMEDVLPPMLRTLPSTVPESDKNSGTEVFQARPQKNKTHDFSTKDLRLPTPTDPPQPAKLPKLTKQYAEDGSDTSSFQPSRNVVPAVGQGDAVGRKESTKVQAPVSKHRSNEEINAVNYRIQETVDKSQEYIDRQTPPFLMGAMMQVNSMIDGKHPAPGPTPNTPPKQLKEKDEPTHPDVYDQLPIVIDLDDDNDAESQSLDSSYVLAKRTGALTHTKMPSPANSLSADAPFVVNGRRQSISRKTGQLDSKEALTKSTHVNDVHERGVSMSELDISHAEGDTSDNMAEDDFWAI